MQTGICLLVLQEPLSALEGNDAKGGKVHLAKNQPGEVNRKSQWLAPAAQELLPELVHCEPGSLGILGRGQSCPY